MARGRNANPGAPEPVKPKAKKTTSRPQPKVKVSYRPMSWSPTGVGGFRGPRGKAGDGLTGEAGSTTRGKVDGSKHSFTMNPETVREAKNANRVTPMASGKKYKEKKVSKKRGIPDIAPRSINESVKYAIFTKPKGKAVPMRVNAKSKLRGTAKKF